MRKLLPVLIVFLGLLVSCSTASAVFKSNFEGLPLWYYIPDSQVKKDKTVFLGQGIAYTERQAKLLAYSDLAASLADFIGEKLDDEDVNSLNVNGVISRLGLLVTDYDISSANGEYMYLLRATADKTLLESARSTAAEERQNLRDSVNSKINEGVDYMRNGFDLLAVEEYILALSEYCKNPDVGADWTYDELYQECLDIIDYTNITISDAVPSKATCRVSVTIDEGSFSSPVSNYSVISSYEAVGVDRKTYSDKFSFITDENGSFIFSPQNYTVKISGTVVFSLDLEDLISDFEKKAGVAAVSKLRSAYESKKVSFDYDLVFSEGLVGLAIMDFGSSGETNQYFTEPSLKSKFSDVGIKTVSVACNSNMDDKTILENFRYSNPSASYLLISRIAQTESYKSVTGDYVVNCEGAFSFYNVKTGEILRSTEVTYSTALSKDEDEARKEAFLRLADLFFSFIRSVYV